MTRMPCFSSSCRSATHQSDLGVGPLDLVDGVVLLSIARESLSENDSWSRIKGTSGKVLHCFKQLNKSRCANELWNRICACTAPHSLENSIMPYAHGSRPRIRCACSCLAEYMAACKSQRKKPCAGTGLWLSSGHLISPCYSSSQAPSAHQWQCQIRKRAPWGSRSPPCSVENIGGSESRMKATPPQHRVQT